MSNSYELSIYNSFSYIHFSLHFIYLHFILFLNTLDHIIFSNMLENTNANTLDFEDNYSSQNINSFNNKKKSNFDSTIDFNIFDTKKNNFLVDYTENQIKVMNNLIFSE